MRLRCGYPDRQGHHGANDAVRQAAPISGGFGRQVNGKLGQVGLMPGAVAYLKGLHDGDILAAVRGLYYVSVFIANISISHIQLRKYDMRIIPLKRPV